MSTTSRAWSPSTVSADSGRPRPGASGFERAAFVGPPVWPGGLVVPDDVGIQLLDRAVAAGEVVVPHDQAGGGGEEHLGLVGQDACGGVRRTWVRCGAVRCSARPARLWCGRWCVGNRCRGPRGSSCRGGRPVGLKGSALLRAITSVSISPLCTSRAAATPARRPRGPCQPVGRARTGRLSGRLDAVQRRYPRVRHRHVGAQHLGRCDGLGAVAGLVGRLQPGASAITRRGQ